MLPLEHNDVIRRQAMKKRITILLALLLLLTGCATQPAKEPDALTDTQGNALPREDLQDQEH
jgi:uncharacterized lipoprotein YajG